MHTSATGPNNHLPSQCSRQDVEALVARLQLVLHDVQSYKHLLGCKESDAQTVLDVFQWLLDNPQLDTAFRRGLIVATQRLSTTSGLYPVCYELKGVVQLTEHPVASGGFADIYKGEFQGQIVCIKAIRVYETSEVEHMLKQFSKEAILWGQLLHLNVLPVYGLYRFRGQLCIVAPWMENNDINKFLKQNPNAPRRRLADDVAHGLQYLHENGVIHGDLKGPNILIDDDGRACVADFGISSISDPEILAWTSHSSAGSKGGSVRWQAPELFDVENDELVKNSVASDVYAWACVCFEIFTGTVPFANFPRDAAVIHQIKLGSRPACPAPSSPPWQDWGLTKAIWNLMQECWKENPADRPVIKGIISRLMPELEDDDRTKGGIPPSARFRERVVEPLNPTTMTTFDRLLAVTTSKTNCDMDSLAAPDRPQHLAVNYENLSVLSSHEEELAWQLHGVKGLVAADFVDLEPREELDALPNSVTPSEKSNPLHRQPAEPQISNSIEKYRLPVSITDTGNYSQTPQIPKPDKQQSSENLIKNFKVASGDPTWKVIPAALKKYGINNDNWQNYAMFICYGSTGNRIERCLSYDEKPLLVFQKLKDAKKNPVFMLKHVKDIRSPIAVAQQKHAARKATSIMTTDSTTTTAENDSLKLRTPEPVKQPLASASVSAEDVPVYNDAVSYAVAIYPYMAEQGDEFDVVVGDTFVILSRARGWWIVQRDSTGSGIIKPDKQGWVPAGCLLETNVPIASAIAKAKAAMAYSVSGALPDTPASKAPILPSSIISTGFLGIALMDYQKKGEEELGLVKGVTMKVFKRYNHWSYAVKEDGSDRGWVPSWFIGKVGQPAK